jgi:hypothetical protein
MAWGDLLGERIAIRPTLSEAVLEERARAMTGRIHCAAPPAPKAVEPPKREPKVKRHLSPEAITRLRAIFSQPHHIERLRRQARAQRR